ncbi:FecR family protein [Yeosuana sp. MJ-SS3]|uniref:FecR family protein n=1 Tax=Gilvirhabdus luticola TaxID=3079858 RepID=A0ABU3U6C2_9FLAO|nr:FecR family protein [Yeosuana sp. MJ-SS3]MDU8885953.1 FecR family protein [Yeosuana sp. MJ-SS3]
MERENLIKKWLDNELNSHELKAFKKLEDYDELTSLDFNLQHFKADDYDTSIELNKLKVTVKATESNKSKTVWLKPLFRVAAILAICFSVYFYTTTLDTTVKTLASEKTSIELPDASNVSLNAESFIVFNKKKWDESRDVQLEGEAFFKVAKGSTFNVITETGTVTVFGTEFNVKQRDNYFEVICYEGLVGVTYKSQQTKLSPGDSFLIIDGKLIAKEKEISTTPSWLNNESQFESLPYNLVIAEFERQYNVKINSETIDTDQLFTGGFSHNNIDVALKSITLPLHITYSKTNNTITLKRE